MPYTWHLLFITHRLADSDIFLRSLPHHCNLDCVPLSFLVLIFRRPHVVQLSQAKMALTCTDIFKFFFALILPPIGVFMERGCNKDLAINILLTCFGFIPGIIHACYIILNY